MKIVTELAKSLGINVDTLRTLASEAPKKYKVYKIPKRTSGYRIIAQPTPEIKGIQRNLVRILSTYLPVHDSSYAYITGRSVKDNAILHSKNSYFLKMDFSNFFNSITPNLLADTIKKNTSLTKSEFNIIKKIAFWSPSKKTDGFLCLSVGAPSSPFISNAICHDFDSKISEICEMFDITYSRYADDLTFSTNHSEILSHLERYINIEIGNFFDNQIELNKIKTSHSSKKFNRHVTGITISNDNKISLGRSKKRYIKHLVHRFILDSLSEKEIKSLKGIISFAKHIEPSFIYSLKRKYTTAVIKNLVG